MQRNSNVRRAILSSARSARIPSTPGRATSSIMNTWEPAGSGLIPRRPSAPA
jgi:hypothetical protein